MVGRPAALVADPGRDELPAQEVVADLLGRQLLGVEEGGEGLVGAVAGGQGAGDFERVPDPALGGQGAGVDAGAEVGGYLHVAEFGGGGYPVDGDVRRARRRSTCGCRPGRGDGPRWRLR